jgi:hypothetical protein
MVQDLLDRPDILDPIQNRTRLRLFYVARAACFVEIPPDTQWFRVERFTHDDIGSLYAINRRDWRSKADGNELVSVAKRKLIPLRQDPVHWEPPILWGHQSEGPFTILEGNSRLVAYVNSGRTDLNISVLIGLSGLPSYWHVPDDAAPLMQDMLGRAT